MTRYNAFAGTTITLSALFMPLALTAVVLRMVARGKTKARFGLDDLLAIITLVVYFSFCATVLWGTENGGDGYSVTMLPIEVLTTQLKAVYASTILSASTISIAKFSILMFYRRAFGADKRLRLAIFIVGAMSVAWWVAASLGAALRCTPVKSQINPLVKGNCYNVQRFFISVEIPNCLLDFAIVAMPIGVVQGLHLQRKHKITLCFIFLLGSFVGIISIIRMALVYNLSGSDFNTQSGYWLQVQLSVAIVCICLPTLRPLIPKGNLFSAQSKDYCRSLLGLSTRSWKHAAKKGSHDRSTSDDESVGNCAKHYRNLGEDSSDEVVLTTLSSGHHPRNSNTVPTHPELTVAVERDTSFV